MSGRRSCAIKFKCNQSSECECEFIQFSVWRNWDLTRINLNKFARGLRSEKGKARGNSRRSQGKRGAEGVRGETFCARVRSAAGDWICGVSAKDSHLELFKSLVWARIIIECVGKRMLCQLRQSLISTHSLRRAVERYFVVSVVPETKRNVESVLRRHINVILSFHRQAPTGKKSAIKINRYKF